MAARGRLATPASKTPPSLDDIEPMPSLAITPQPTSPALEDADLIAYFNGAVLPRFQIDDKLVHLDFDAVVQDDTLQQAILAVAEAHYAQNSKLPTTQLAGVRKRARFRAIESFRQLLDTGILQESTAQQLFTINVLLCMLDGVIEPTSEYNASICHLRGGFAILSRWKNTCVRMLIQGGMQAHLLSVFTTMDLFHAILKGEKPFFDSVTWLMFANTPTWFGSLPSHDSFLAILKAYSEAACLGNIVFDSTKSDASLQIVERCLPNVTANFALPLRVERQTPVSEHSEYAWETFCSVYRICGLIYVERALRLKDINDDAVQSHVRRGVEMLIDNVLPGMMSHCLVFPVLVIGSHSIHSQDRRAVLEVLSPTSSYLSFGSLCLMETFLQQHWSCLDLQSTWWASFESISETAFLF